MGTKDGSELIECHGCGRSMRLDEAHYSDPMGIDLCAECAPPDRDPRNAPIYEMTDELRRRLDELIPKMQRSIKKAEEILSELQNETKRRRERISDLLSTPQEPTP